MLSELPGSDPATARSASGFPCLTDSIFAHSWKYEYFFYHGKTGIIPPQQIGFSAPKPAGVTGAECHLGCRALGRTHMREVESSPQRENLIADHLAP